MEVFKDYAYYYDMIYKDKDYRKEAETVAGLLSRYSLRPVKNVLNIGCGTGRHDRELVKLGYRMSGVDMSEDMIRIARQGVGEGCDFLVGDARSFRDNKKRDAVISLFHVMSYQTGNNDLLRSFQTAAENLGKGGIFLFDVWYGPGVLTELPSVRVKKIEDESNTLIRCATPRLYPQKNIVDVCYDVVIVDKKTGVASEIEEVHSMRYLFTPEIQFLLEQAGFVMEACLDCDTLEEAGYESWTAYIAARKV